MRYPIARNFIFWAALLSAVIAETNIHAENNATVTIHSRKTVCSDAVAFTPDGRFALSAKNGVISIWDLSQGRLSKRVGIFDGSFKKVVFSPAADRVLLTEFFGQVKVWNIAEGMLEDQFEVRFNIDCCAFSQDGRCILFGGSITEEDLYLPFLWEIGRGRGMAFSGESHIDRITSVTASPDGKLIATGSKDFTIKIWDVETGQETVTLEGHSEGVNALLFTNDRKLLSLSDYSIRLWDIESGNKIREFEIPHNFAINRLQGPLIMSPDGGYVYCGSEIYEYPSGVHVKSSLKLRDAFSLSHDGRKIISASQGDHNIQILDARLGVELKKRAQELRDKIATGQERKELEEILYNKVYRELRNQTWTVSITQFEGGDWVIMTPEGYFSCSPGADKFLKVKVGNSTYSIDNFHERFFNPGLIVARLNQAGTKVSEDIREGIARPPKLSIVSPNNGENFDQKEVNIVVSAKDIGGGIDEIRLYHNGSAVGGKARGLNIHKSQGIVESVYSINLIPGRNTITAVGFSRDRTKSNPSSIDLFYKEEQALINLYLVTVGINKYSNPGINLNYAVADAVGVKKFFENSWKYLFKGIHFEEIYDGEASKKNIKLKMESLDSREEDVFILYLAGHGMNIGDEWFFLGHEMIHPESEEEVVQKSISATELKEMITNIRSLKKLLIIDACKSGKLLDAFSRGVEDRRAFSLLARSTGTHIIAASTDKQYATEIPRLGHGLFTYTLLAGLQGEWEKSDNIITVRELISYVERELPKISEKYLQPTQYPVIDSRGQDFPLAVIK